MKDKMDLKKWWTFWFVSVLLLIPISGTSLSNNSITTCAPGVTTLGYTYPHGDIILEYGNPLEITCMLYENATTVGQNGSLGLSFTLNNHPVSTDMIKQIDSRSIRLHVAKPAKASSYNYFCVLNKDMVCMNKVYVGTKPQPVEDFECISINYDNLTCSWTPPENFIKTEYNLTFSLGRARASRYANHACPDLTENGQKMSCFWNISTTPPYRQAHNEFNFTLEMKNYLGTNVMHKTFKHFEHVLSGPPENLTAVNTTSSSIYLYWMVPLSMQSFPPGVHHRILYQCSFGEKGMFHFGGLIKDSPNKSEIYFNLTNLKYAHDLCDIRVSIRSAEALVHDESMWSSNASITVRTSSKVPDVPPETNIGSFEIAMFDNIQSREAYIYWKQIKKTQKNGANFSYVAKVAGDDSLKPIEITSAYARFNNLLVSKSYTFHIWSRNSDGFSPEKSTVRIPKQIDRIKSPLSFTKVEFGGGHYELSWEPPIDQLITNYTIFWCSNEKDRPHQCTGELDWTSVPGNTTVVNQTVSKDGIYQFAISTNAPTGSSGMLWAACTVIHNKNMGKMKNVWITRLGSTFIEVGWKLDCSDRVGSVEGFIIYYCPILSPISTDCKGPQNNITFKGDTTVLGGNVTNLTPYTTYMLTVAVITKHFTFSQQSDPLFNTTLESAPSTPPLDLKVTAVTNSSISLSWLPPNATNGKLKYYRVMYNGQSLEIDDPTTYTTIDNLVSYATYSITVTACTTMCSTSTEPLFVQTRMGYPSKIEQPSVTFQNDSYVIVAWSKPSDPRGNNDYYQVQIKQKHQYENRTVPIFNVTSNQYIIENCGDSGKYNTFYLSVRAVNVFDSEPHYGPWSEEFESYCRASVNSVLYILIPCGLLLLCGVGYLLNKMHKKCKIMRDVEVKLPPGLAPAVTDQTLMPWSIEKHQEERDRHSPADEELLLEKMNEGRHLSGDSSGCSSGHESVASSLESGTIVSSSSDSGTEQAGNYCVLGVDPAVNLDLKTDSSYVPITSTVSDANKVPYISCDVATQPSPYVMAGDAVKTVNPGYIPFNQTAEQNVKSSGYVVAGIQNCNGSVITF